VVVIEAAKLPAAIGLDLDRPIAEARKTYAMQASFCSLRVEGAPMNLEDLADA
jgi:hypothetical protein